MYVKLNLNFKVRHILRRYSENQQTNKKSNAPEDFLFESFFFFFSFLAIPKLFIFIINYLIQE